MIQKLTLAVVLAFALTVPVEKLHAETIFKYGLGVFNSAKDSAAETKFASLAYQDEFLGLFIYQFEGGFWYDTREDMGRRSSAFAGASIGVDVDVRPFFAQWLVGPSVISTKDSYLGGPLQFNNDVAFGLRDHRGNSVGIGYKHLSSAGIFEPNKGRDFLMLRIGIPW